LTLLHAWTTISVLVETGTFAHIAYHRRKIAMTKQAQKTEVPKEGRVPTHALFHMEERKGDKWFWTEIAAGWENEDGSVNIRTHVGAMLLPGQAYRLRSRQAKNGSEEGKE
jgi:hypothetical protein